MAAFKREFGFICCETGHRHTVIHRAFRRSLQTVFLLCPQPCFRLSHDERMSDWRNRHHALVLCSEHDSRANAFRVCYAQGKTGFHPCYPSAGHALPDHALLLMAVAGLGVVGLSGPCGGSSSGVWPGSSSGRGGSPGSRIGGGASGCGFPGGSSCGGSVG